MRHFVTLFDKNYLSRGLALYQSLVAKSSEDFNLWVLALDVETISYLEYLAGYVGHDKIRIIYLEDLPEEAQKLKNERPWNYFCFGLAPEVIVHVMSLTQKTVTYLDADSYFFQDPKLVFEQMGDKSVGIVSHNFPPHDYARLSPNGLYNVSMVIAKPDGDGWPMMRSWRDGVRKKCDKESCGDQLYLNEFPKLLKDKLHIFDGISIGAGPWNVYTYKTEAGPSVCGVPLIYYHFHEFRIKDDGYYHLTGYPIDLFNINHIYEPYMKVIDYMEKDINKKKKEGFFNA